MTERADPAKPYQRAFAEHLRELREQRSITDHLLAESVGVTAQYVQMIEQTRRPPTKRILDAIVDSLCLTETDAGSLYHAAGMAYLEARGWDPSRFNGETLSCE